MVKYIKSANDDIDEINKMRKQLGMKKLTVSEPQTKNCLRCDKEFVSEGKHHRVCNTCYCKPYRGI